MAEKAINVKVFRYNPETDAQPHYETYVVPYEKGISAFNVLKYINSNYDGGLAYYISCRIGVCMGCMIRINGKPQRACSYLVTEEDLTLEPLNKDKVIKDLLCKS